MVPAFYGHTNSQQIDLDLTSSCHQATAILSSLWAESWLSAVVSQNLFVFASSNQDLDVSVLLPRPWLLACTSVSPHSSFSSTCHQVSHLWLCCLSLDTSEYIQLCIFWQKAWRHSLVFCTCLEKWHSQYLQSLSRGFCQLCCTKKWRKDAMPQ